MEDTFTHHIYAYVFRIALHFGGTLRILANQNKYFESAPQCSKRDVATWL